MRLWHQLLLNLLPRQQLLGQHRECCALRGNGWRKKHSTVDYVFRHSPFYLVAYHKLVMDAMECRGYSPDPAWKDWAYRGKNCEAMVSPDPLDREFLIIHNRRDSVILHAINDISYNVSIIYSEHTDEYLQECVNNLRTKGHFTNVDIRRAGAPDNSIVAAPITR